MRELRVATDGEFHGLKVVTLENHYLRVHILPEAGAKIWQITYKPLDANLLWNNPRITPARQSINACYDDVWSGGWDELFPNDEVATIAGENYPDHGELWVGEWNANVFEDASEAGVTLRYLTPISSVQIEKRVVLPRREAQLLFSHTFTNLGHSDFPFLWKLHPAFEVTPQHRIDFPPMRVTLEPAFPGTLAGASPAFAWPHARIGAKTVDLRRIPSESEQQLYFFYGTELRQGWCALTDTATRLSARTLHWLPLEFRGHASGWAPQDALRKTEAHYRGGFQHEGGHPLGWKRKPRRHSIRSDRLNARTSHQPSPNSVLGCLFTPWGKVPSAPSRVESQPESPTPPQ